MSYIKAADVLPQELVDQIQSYVDGQMIYIPRKELNRKSWGALTKSKEATLLRNREIYRDYREGMSVQALSERYSLAPKSIQKIVARFKNN